MEGIEIRRGGRLILTYCPKSGPRIYRERDVTSQAPGYLFERVTFEHGLKLRDVFLLIKRHLDIFAPIFGNWCREIVREGLSSKPVVGKLDKSVRGLEVYWQFTADEYAGKQSSYGYRFPDFHGLGPKVRKRFKEYGFTWPAGSRIPYSVSLSSSRELIDLPITLRDYAELQLKPLDKKPVKIQGPEYALGQALYAIIWELSFYGPPDKRKRKATEIFGLAAEVHRKDRT